MEAPLLQELKNLVGEDCDARICRHSLPNLSIAGEVYMIAHIDEIPYFGEHTQVTVMCHSCGWKQTDFIPAEGKKAVVGH